MSTATLKAIETKYKGYRFRSRLEARWAVFFDAAGIEWLYEHEGFDLEGKAYLPDFWLPEHRAFIEIKPAAEARRDIPGELELCTMLAEQSGHVVVMLSGDCYPGNYQLTMFRREGWGVTDETMLDATTWPFSSLLRCRRCDGLCYAMGSDSETWDCWGDIGKHTCGDHDRPPLEFPEEFYAAARSARFDGRAS